MFLLHKTLHLLGVLYKKCRFNVIYLFITAKGHKGHLHRSKNYYVTIQLESPWVSRGGVKFSGTATYFHEM